MNASRNEMKLNLRTQAGPVTRRNKRCEITTNVRVFAAE